MTRSAFIVPVPEAEPVVGSLRARYDPVAALGVPAHITLLFPFKAPDAIADHDLARVSALLDSQPPFDFSLRSLGRFADTLFLAPEPAAPFVTLTQMLVQLFPAYRPYGGAHDGIIPHLTVARSDLGEAEARLNATMPLGGIAARCSRLVLIGEFDGAWRDMRAFPLGAHWVRPQSTQ